MNEKDAKQLLTQIKNAEEDLNRLGSYLKEPAPRLSLGTQLVSSINPFAAKSKATQDIERTISSRLNKDTINSLLKGMFIVAGGGAALRGLSGLGESVTPRKKKQTGRVVEMPVPYEVKAARSNSLFSGATSIFGLPYTFPAALLGLPLSFYGGWKGVDALLDQQRRAQTASELDEAKQDYESALLSSYKTASASSSSISSDLSNAFKALHREVEKAAFFENAPGALTGLGAAYALTTLPLGYYVVDKQMKKYNRKAILEKALKERARRAAVAQPPEIYAIPSPVSSAPESV